MKVLLYVVILFVVFGFAVGGWFTARKVNYGCMYRSLVKQTIQEMVKQEALK